MLKKYFLLIGLLIGLRSYSQDPILVVIKQGIKKVIVAMDLKIQRIQNQTIWLQNAQKTIENTMSKLQLTEITGWVEQQRKLYEDYFQELWNVKAVITRYQRVKDIIETQAAIVREYKAAWSLFRQDKNFTTEELAFMFNIYTGMLEEAMKIIEHLQLVVRAYALQTTDAKRLELINTAAERMEQLCRDLQEFNNQNKIMSLQRTTERGEIEYLKRLYGL